LNREFSCVECHIHGDVCRKTVSWCQCTDAVCLCLSQVHTSEVRSDPPRTQVTRNYFRQVSSCCGGQFVSWLYTDMTSVDPRGTEKCLRAQDARRKNTQASGRNTNCATQHRTLLAQTCRKLIRFEVFATVTMKNSVFWDVTPCGS
jgi:hypothetical protein